MVEVMAGLDLSYSLGLVELRDPEAASCRWKKEALWRKTHLEAAGNSCLQWSFTLNS